MGCWSIWKFFFACYLETSAIVTCLTDRLLFEDTFQTFLAAWANILNCWNGWINNKSTASRRILAFQWRFNAIFLNRNNYGWGLYLNLFGHDGHISEGRWLCSRQAGYTLIDIFLPRFLLVLNDLLKSNHFLPPDILHRHQIAHIIDVVKPDLLFWTWAIQKSGKAFLGLLLNDWVFELAGVLWLRVVVRLVIQIVDLLVYIIAQKCVFQRFYV